MSDPTWFSSVSNYPRNRFPQHSSRLLDGRTSLLINALDYLKGLIDASGGGGGSSWEAYNDLAAPGSSGATPMAFNEMHRYEVNGESGLQRAYLPVATGDDVGKKVAITFANENNASHVTILDGNSGTIDTKTSFSNVVHAVLVVRAAGDWTVESMSVSSGG